MQKEIAENLCMSKNFHTISSNTIRANIKLNVSKRCASTGGNYTAEESFETSLKPVISELCLQFQNFDRTIVYSKLKYCAMGFELVRREAMKLSLEDVSQVMNAVSQYHAPSTTKMKEKTVHKMCDPSSQLKLLFATEAYSMGTDAPNIRRIIHFGPPSSLETYLQEIGRGGRDGAQCIATLFYNASDIGSNVKNMKEEVKQFCALKTCRRKFLTDHFGFSYEQNMTPHTCCDVCELKCQCDNCIVAIADKIENDVAMESQASSRKTKNSTLLVEVLRAYFDAENSQLDIPNPDVFTKSLLTDLVNSTEDFVSEDCLKQKFSHLQPHFLSNIYEIIQNVSEI
ncbi:uncharacterized protein LOC134235496 [Saccostrea cucullata]|uniref:uncharacterized protein LOC134235496 n=1 Tax=Saccostrea cuccullata TaxID=36930 RepID=UPI002ED52216